ncbi:hypothetical protein [Pasteurella oralis]|uniref:hypothetical protein n=1 Tax=Pasteurella oralis TaxID=1071947 RepID=UPI000C7966BE|nr:hypothetical protein [Pasteurella oralis]
MNNVLFKTSLLIGLSTLVTACGSGNGNHTSHTSPQQTHQSNNTNYQNTNTQSQNSSTKQIQSRVNQQYSQSNKKEENTVSNKLEKEILQIDTAQQWIGQCVTSEYCGDNSFSNKINVYDIKHTDDAKPADSNPDKTTEMVTTITLTSKNTSGNGYSFTLFGNDNSGYYGYRQRANNAQDGRHYDFLYAVKTDVNNNELPSNYTANYTKERGFIYSPLSLSSSSSSDNLILKYGNVYLTYENGKITGDIEDSQSRDKTYPTFKLSGNDTNLIITSTDNVPPPISPNEKGVVEVHFINSEKNTHDYKYLVGTGQSYPGTGKVGWIGVIFAEKKR